MKRKQTLTSQGRGITSSSPQDQTHPGRRLLRLVAREVVSQLKVAQAAEHHTPSNEEPPQQVASHEIPNQGSENPL